VFLVALLAILDTRDMKKRILYAGIAVVLAFGLLSGLIEAKVWGVVLMGSSLVVLFFLSWLDQSPVKSIRYRGWIYKLALALFIVAFVLLGYLGMKPASGLNVILAQGGTVVYFLFFFLMPFYTKWDKTKPVPERVTS
jgi:ubiquinol-cytochrome c reductase cytochrome b subunit